MRVCDIHAEVEDLLGVPVPPSSVKNWLAKHAQGKNAQFVRLGRGRYLAAVD